MDRMEQQDLTELRVMQGHKGQRETMAQTVQMDRMETQDLQEMTELKAFRDSRVIREMTVALAPQAYRETQAHREYKDHRAPQGAQRRGQQLVQHSIFEHFCTCYNDFLDF